MVIEFLKKMRSEFIEQRMKLESERKSIQITLSKNSKYIQKLKEEDEQNYDAFSPRKQNTNLKDKIRNLENEKKNLLERLEQVNQNLNLLDNRFLELDEVCKEVKRKSIEDKKEETRTVTNLNDLEVLNDLIHHLEFSLQLIYLDPNRCKLELTSALRQLNQIIYDKNI